jgi:DNA-binding SARP family transcriptional activator
MADFVTAQFPVSAGPASSEANALCLFGGPYVLQGGSRVTVPEGSKRLLVYVALHDGRLDRRQIAGTLWPYGDDERAGGNLRSALWRLKGAGIDMIAADKCALWLRPGTPIDVESLNSWAGRLIGGTATTTDIRVPRWTTDAIDLLPGFYDEWILFERERVRQRLLHALEALSREFVKVERYAEAIEVALDAVKIEPLRETAQRVLLEAHLAEGNFVEARRLYRDYRALVRQELQIEPSPAITRMILGFQP